MRNFPVLAGSETLLNLETGPTSSVGSSASSQTFQRDHSFGGLYVIHSSTCEFLLITNRNNCWIRSLIRPALYRRRIDGANTSSSTLSRHGRGDGRLPVHRHLRRIVPVAASQRVAARALLSLPGEQDGILQVFPLAHRSSKYRLLDRAYYECTGKSRLIRIFHSLWRNFVFGMVRILIIKVISSKYQVSV